MLEVYYQQVLERQQGRPIPELPATAAYRFLQRFRDAEGWRSFYERASTMLEVYLDRWRHADDYWQILAVEYTCGWTAATHPQLVAQAGFELTTRLDLLVVDHTVPTAPLTRHIEHKSAHSLDVTTVMGYSQDDQVLGQCFLGRYWVDWQAAGYPPYGGAIVNITTKAKAPKCERLPVQPSDAQLAEWALSKRYWYELEKTYAAAGYPRNYTQCTRRFGRCAHFDLCRGNPLVDAQQLVAADAAGDLPPNYRRGGGLPEDE